MSLPLFLADTVIRRKPGVPVLKMGVPMQPHQFLIPRLAVINAPEDGAHRTISITVVTTEGSVTTRYSIEPLTDYELPGLTIIGDVLANLSDPEKLRLYVNPGRAITISLEMGAAPHNGKEQIEFIFRDERPGAEWTVHVAKMPRDPLFEEIDPTAPEN